MLILLLHWQVIHRLIGVAVNGIIPNDFAIPCPLGNPRANPLLKFREASIAIIPLPPGMLSRPFAKTLSIFLALLFIGTEHPYQRMH
jgi:hypothetical protein